MGPGERERVAVIGLGASGEAAAHLALAKGARVHVTDSKSEDPVAARGAALRGRGAEVRLGRHDIEEIAAADTVVVSPGIGPGAPVLAALRARGVRWVSEPEYASRFIESPLTVVTGTNGKTTTAALCAHILCAGGVDAALGGNIGGGLGPPASTLALMDPPPERIVLELSSFQLADIRDLTPDVGVMTNLGVDHMDRYDSVEAYHRDKRRLFEAGGENTTWVVNADDEAVMAMSGAFPGTRLSFSLERQPSPGAFATGGGLFLAGRADGPRRVAGAADLQLLGRHNVANALAAILAASASGAPRGHEAAGLAGFGPLPHRLEPVGTVRGVRWVNDSKATNVAAAASALGSLDGPVVLLVGGTDKGEDFRGLLPAMRDRVRAVVTYGAAGRRAEAELTDGAGGPRGAAGSKRGSPGVAPPVTCVAGSFAEAVDAARALARPGDALLLAPACSSFDMFENYQQRGDAFRALAGAGAP